jgi:hypothetical protein
MASWCLYEYPRRDFHAECSLHFHARKWGEKTSGRMGVKNTNVSSSPVEVVDRIVDAEIAIEKFLAIHRSQ